MLFFLAVGADKGAQDPGRNLPRSHANQLGGPRGSWSPTQATHIVWECLSTVRRRTLDRISCACVLFLQVLRSAGLSIGRARGFHPIVRASSQDQSVARFWKPCSLKHYSD